MPGILPSTGIVGVHPHGVDCPDSQIEYGDAFVFRLKSLSDRYTVIFRGGIIFWNLLETTEEKMKLCGAAVDTVLPYFHVCLNISRSLL